MPTYNMEEGGLSYRFNRCRVKVQVMGGGFGNGKTAGLCIKAIEVARDYPGCNILLGRATYSKLNDTLRKEFYKWIPPASVRRWPTKDDNTMYLKNGTVINFRYVAQKGKTSEDGQTTSNLLSATYDFIGIDQIEDPEIVEKDFRDLFGRLRGATPYRGTDPTMPRTGPRWIIVTCNPTGNWFYRKVIKPYHMYMKNGTITDDLIMSKRSQKLMIEVFEGSTYENKANLEDDFLELMESGYSGQMYDRFVLGKWGAFEGLVYPNFNEDIHFLSEEFLIKYLEKLRDQNVHIKSLEAYDYGMAVPSCYGLAFIDNWGRIFFVDGFYEKEFPIHDTEEGRLGQASTILKIRNKWSNYIDIKGSVIADPDMFRRKTMPGYKSVGSTIANEFSDLGIKMRAGDNSVDAGIMKVSGYLNRSKRVPSLIPGQRSPMMFFNGKTMGFVSDEFGNYFWKRNPQGEQEDKTQDRNDHAMDMIKYALSFKPKASEIVIPKESVMPGYMYWHEIDDEEEMMMEREF